MTPQEAAAKLNNSEYLEEGSKKLFGAMKAAGLIAVFGASDDLMEIDGAISEEFGARHGSRVYFTKRGPLRNECPEANCPYHVRERQKASFIEAIWAQDDISWQYKTDIPHMTFDVYEDDELYCRGIVFALADVPDAPK